jgi:uncharacterized protein (TIGR00299 family) protein
MKYAYFDASSGLSGDMILAALLDLGVPHAHFKKTMAVLGLPVSLRISEAKRAGLRGLKADVVLKAASSKPRRFADIRSFLKKSKLSSSVKDKALDIFRNLFAAEAKVHGRAFKDVHLHEAGADDALIDVVGACFLAETLRIGKVYCSPLNVGRGWVKTSHGVLPVPPPAVAELLKNAPVYSAHVRAEMVTPTGAAIITTLAEGFLPFPEIAYEKIGYGAGSRDIPGFPNVLRVFYGEEREFHPSKKVYLIEAAIDDANPQVLAHFLGAALKLGALDASLSPVVMKKNRLGSKLTLLAGVDKIDDLIAAVFRETTSIGVRYFPVERRVLERKVLKVRVLGENVGIKVGSLDGQAVNAQPEFSDCLAVAAKKRLPVKDVLQRAAAEYRKKVQE